MELQYRRAALVVWRRNEATLRMLAECGGRLAVVREFMRKTDGCGAHDWHGSLDTLLGLWTEALKTDGGTPEPEAHREVALPEECVPVAVERVSDATSLPEFEHPESAAYVFGPENGSLDESILERCTQVVCIPGHECSNLAAAVNVVLYDRISKRWLQVRDVFPPTDGVLRGVGGGYEARLDREDD